MVHHGFDTLTCALRLQIRFPMQKKKDGGRVSEQPSTSNVASERDPELEQLEQGCYTSLLDCCKTLAHEAGVNYTTIMNLQVGANDDVKGVHSPCLISIRSKCILYRC